MKVIQIHKKNSNISILGQIQTKIWNFDNRIQDSEQNSKDLETGEFSKYLLTAQIIILCNFFVT